VDAVGRLQPRIDPLAVLPPELWIPILCEALDQASCGHFNLSNEGLLHLILVSQRWRRQIMDVPILWSCIHINDGPSGGQDTPVHLATFAHLSQTCPLDITFHLPLPSWNIVRENLVIQRGQIRAINFIKNGSGEEESHYILRYLSPLRHLTRIGGSTFNPDQLIMEGSPLEQAEYSASRDLPSTRPTFDRIRPTTN
jgi:hypothetical protein